MSIQAAQGFYDHFPFLEREQLWLSIYACILAGSFHALH
jgi:hypothetical protein